MPLIPWKYIQESLFLPKSFPDEIGKKLTYYGLETKVVEKEGEVYLEFDLLPNRPDLLSWWGVIQEMATILNCQIKPISLPTIKESKQKTVEVEIKSQNCYAFCLGLVRNVEIKESTPLIKEWLRVNNIQPVNNVVDAANLVMLESGQPLHIFDYDSLPEKKELVIRQAHEGEIIISLKNHRLALNSEDVVMSSGKKFVDLMGIVGAQETSITLQTKNILIECASFNSEVIKKTTNRLSITTSASRYFCRPNSSFSSPRYVLQQVISLIIDSYKGDWDSGEFFIYKEIAKKDQPTVIISQDFITVRTGQKFPKLVIEDIWKRLNFSYQKKEDFYHVVVPCYRSDIINQEDLLEELLKVYDYNEIVSQLPSDFKSISFLTEGDNNERKKREIRTYLASCGWQEVITYSLVGSEIKTGFNEIQKDSPYYELLIPKNEYHKYYRQTFIPSHLKIISYNLSHSNKNLFFFEIGSTYSPKKQEELLILSGVGKFFHQPFHKLTSEIDFYWIKGVVENIFFLWQIEKEIFFAPTSINFLTSSQSVEIFLNKEKIGFCGQIFPQITQNYQINESVFVAQFSLTKIFDYLANFPRSITYKAISNFPVSERDLSFLFPKDVDYNQVKEEIKNVGGEKLVEINIFDVYQNAEMNKKGQKSVSYHLVFQSFTRTLENKEVEEIIIKISERVEKLFSAKLRVK